MRLITGAFALSLLGTFAVGGICSAETFEDTFTGPTLNPEWATVIPRPGPTLAVSNGVTFTDPAGNTYSDWKFERNSPRIEVPAPDGDFTLTAHLKSVTTTDGSPLAGFAFHAGIVLAYRENATAEEAYIFGPNSTDQNANLERTAFGQEGITGVGIPMWLRVQRTGNQYHFFARAEGSTDSDWQELQQADGNPAVKTMNEPLMNVGLTLKTWATTGVTATFDDFKLETTATLKHFGFVSGTVTSSSGDFDPVKVDLVNSVGRVAAEVAPDATGKYTLAAVPGTYTVKVAPNNLIVNQPGELINTTPVTVTAGQTSSGASFSLQTLQSMTLNSGWKLVTGLDNTLEAYDAIGDATYDDSSDLDVVVPSDANAAIGANIGFAYRVHITVPDGWVGKDLALDNFVMDDGVQATYFNGTNLGSSAEATGGPGSPWAYSQTIAIPGNLVKKDNVLVVAGYQGGGGGGMTGNAPTLHTTSQATGIITGKAVTVAGTPTGATLSFLNASGKTAATVQTSGPLNGTYTVAGLQPGAYTLDPTTGTFADSSTTFTVQAGKILTLPNIGPGNGVSLASAALTGTGWKVGAVAADDYSAAQDSFDDSTLTDAPVPGDISTLTDTSGTVVISANAPFVYRLKFDAPASLLGQMLVMDNFLVDDGTIAVYLNGANLGSTVEATGGPANPWTVNQTYLIPSTLLKATGNVLAIFGYQGGGGGGLTGGAPVLHPLSANVGIVTGKLVDSTGAPVGNSATFLDANGKVAFGGTSSGPINGQFTFAALPGTYTLDTLVTQFSGAPASVTVTGGQVTDLGSLTVSPYPFAEGTAAGPYDDDFSAALNAKWKIGSVGDATNSAADTSGGTLNVTDQSSNIWVNPNDNFTYVYQSIPNGDYAVSAQVVNVPDTVDWEIGGLMLRQTLDPWSPMGFNQVTPRYNTQDKNRLVQDADDTDNSTGSPIGTDLMATGNLYVKMRKVGTRVAFFWTTDPTDPAQTHLGHIFDLTGLTGSDLLVGFASDSAQYEATDTGFQYDNFKVVQLASVQPTCTPGDLNADAQINVSDAVLTLKAAVSLITLTDAQKAAADVNGDDLVNVADAVKILKKAVQLPDDTWPTACSD